MALPSSGEISILDIFRNRENSTTANPGANENLDLESLSEFFASGSVVGNVDGTGTANTTDDRDALNSAPYSFSEFYDANYPNDIFSNVVAKVGTTSVMSNGFVDGETAKIEWDIDDGTTDDYTAGLKDATTNAIIVSATLDDDGGGKTVSVTMTVPNREHNDDDYYPFVTTGTFSNIVGANINHYDAISSVSINDPSNRTVAADTSTATETHTATIGDADSLSAYAWTFAKDGTVTADGGNPSPTTATTAAPTVTYTGPGRYTSVLTVKGGRNAADTSTSTAVEARNSVTSTTQTFDITYADAITVDTPNDTNEGSITVQGTHKGMAGGVKVGVVTSTSTSTFLGSNTTDTTNSEFEAAAVSKASTVTATNTTITAKGRIEDKASSTNAALSTGTFKIYPDVSTEFASGDISISPNPAIVGQNVTLSVGNVTDNITGYAWAYTSGTGTMTSTNATGGGAGTSTATIINEQTAVTNTVVFNTAQASKTVRLTLNARLSQTDSADATLSVELADSVQIDNIKNSTGTATVTAINGGAGIRLTGTAAGQQHGAIFGLVTSTANTTFLTSGTYTTQTDTTDSRYATDSWASTTITPTDEVTTRTIQGRVVDRNSLGGEGGTDADNSDSITVFPTLNSTRNVINPSTTQTIFSTTNNTDTSSYPTSFTFSSTLGNPTDNVTAHAYTETSTALTITNATTVTATVIATSAAAANQTVTLTVSGTGASGTQTSATSVGVNVKLMPKPLTLTTNAGSGTGTIFNQYNISATWQGFAIEDSNDKVVLQLFNNATSTQVGGDVEYNGTNSAINPDGSEYTSGTFGISNQQFDTLFSSLNAAGTYLVKGKFISNSSQVGSTLETGTFNLTKPQQINIIGVYDEDEGGSTTFYGGFKSQLEAANEDDSNSDASTPTTDNVAVFVADTTIDNGEKISTNSDLSNNFDGDPQNNNSEVFYAFQNFVFEIKDNGDVTGSRSRTPDVPSAPTEVSKGTNDITIGIAANTQVTSTFSVHVSPTINSTNTSTNFSATANVASHTQNQSLKAIFGNTNLAAGTAYTIKVRGQNSHANSNYSTTATITTDSAAVDWTTTISNFSLASNATSPTKTAVLINGSGDVDISSDNSDALLAYSTTSTSTGFSTFAQSHSNIGFSSGNFYMKVKSTHTDRFPDFADITVRSDNATSGDGQFTFVVTLNGTDEGGFVCIADTMLLNTEAGMLHINDLREGDMVLTHNFDTGIDELVEVTKILRVQHHVYSVKFTDNTEMILTDDHPMISVDNQMLSINETKAFDNYNLDAQKLVVGDEIKTTNGFVVVDSITKLEEPTDTYTITTKNNNFYTNNILVHSEIIEE